MQLLIRPENPSDYAEIKNLIKKAFETMVHSDHQEQDLVERLRKSSAYVPELAWRL